MSTESIFKDITGIHARIFHHKAALQGHINFFVKEFEDRRGEREALRINSTFKNISYIKDQGLPNSIKALDECLTELKENVDIATSKCKVINEQEGKGQRDEEPKFLATERERREKEWAEFIALQCERSALVDEEHDSQIQELRTHYSDLENKLKSSTKVL